ncbi:MAG: 2-oxoacid:acceptor oxidoreductase subunit alpha [Candidatus Nealsonbacteria bacterium]|nr:2-oxoacid:acceptor oxidoreductase subunit alpha [Candidatus Nealsonbacteria bacterium]
MKDRIIIGIVGAGGDGVVTVGELLLKIAQMKGYYGRLSKYYGPQIRGGESAVKLTILAENQEGFIEDDLDILVCFSQAQLVKFKEELSVNSQTKIFDEEFLKSFAKISSQITGREQSKNLVALGFLLEILGWREKEILEALRPGEKLLTDKNLEAVEAGKTEAEKIQLRIKLPTAYPKETIIIDGNQAISRGALGAGCRFASTYPITPASEIGEYLSHELSKIGGCFVQGESEIASIGMILGASLAGVKSMTATSGPGLDLMVEMINLASSCEISLIIVDAQRVGPSTGIPTKMEQADLATVIFSGHGYAPRVVLAPYNFEECYRLTFEAFNISEKYQVPVILLSDQYLSQTSQITDDFLKKIYLIENRLLPLPEDKNKYLRYKITRDYVSPMALPGMEGFEWRATGLTHDEAGNPTNSSEWHQKMQEKITKKLDPLRDRSDLVKIFGPEKAKIGLISWGSSGEASLGAIKSMGLENKIKVCIPEIIAPIPINAIGQFLKGLQKLIIVEMNYSGQYRRYLRRYFDFPKKIYPLKRAGGRPWSRKEMVDFFEEALR